MRASLAGEAFRHSTLAYSPADDVTSTCWSLGGLLESLPCLCYAHLVVENIHLCPGTVITSARRCRHHASLLVGRFVRYRYADCDFWKSTSPTSMKFDTGVQYLYRIPQLAFERSR